MYIKVVTTKIKPTHRRAKKVYQYVKVISRQYNTDKGVFTEYVVATLGTISEVRPHIETLCSGLKALGNK